jgi:hypothetical protein
VIDITDIATYDAVGPIANTGSSMNTNNRYVAGVQAGGTITNIGSITISDSCFIDNSNANTGQAGGAISCCPTTN